MKIHQLSVNYLAEQDRILVRINTAQAEEMRLWLTRRLMLRLWPVLSNLITDHLLGLESTNAALHAGDEELRRMLADFRKEQFLRHADFNTPYQGPPAAVPAGAEPMLVTDVDATTLASGKLRLSFNEKLPKMAEPRKFHVELDSRLMHALLHLLEQALGQSHWHGAPGLPFPRESAAEDDEHAAARPRYLN